MAMLTPPGVDSEVESDLEAAACLFHGFSDSSRLSILQHLALGEHRVVAVSYTHLTLPTTPYV